MNDYPHDVFLPEAPENFIQAILEGRALIRRYERRRRRLRNCALCTAGVLIAVGLALAGMGALQHPAEDNIAAPGIELLAAETPAAPEVVLAHPEDAYYHIFGAYCDQSRGDEVALPLETARDFGKRPCAVCYPDSN